MPHSAFCLQNPMGSMAVTLLAVSWMWVSLQVCWLTQRPVLQTCKLHVTVNLSPRGQHERRRALRPARAHGTSAWSCFWVKRLVPTYCCAKHKGEWTHGVRHKPRAALCLAATQLCLRASSLPRVLTQASWLLGHSAVHGYSLLAPPSIFDMLKTFGYQQISGAKNCPC